MTHRPAHQTDHPGGAAERAHPDEIHGLLAAYLALRVPDHDAGILKVDQVLFLQLLELVQHLVGSVFTFELTTTRSLMDSLLLSERSTEALPGQDD